MAAYVFASPLSRAMPCSPTRRIRLRRLPGERAAAHQRPDLAHDVDTVINGFAFLVFGFTLALMWRKWQRASRIERHALGPVMAMGAIAMAVIEVGLIGQLSGDAAIAERLLRDSGGHLPLPYAFLARWREVA